MAHDHPDVPSDQALRVKALETVLRQMGLIENDDMDATVDLYQNRVGPRNGARIIAGEVQNAGLAGEISPMRVYLK